MKLKIIIFAMALAVIVPLFFGESKMVSFICLGLVLALIIFILMVAKPKQPPPDKFDGSTLKIYPPVKRKKR